MARNRGAQKEGTDMELSSQRELVMEAIANCQAATARVVNLRSSADPDVAALASAVHLLSFGAQQIGLALTDEGRTKDLTG